MQTVTRGKLYLPATPARPPTPPSPTLDPSHISITLSFSTLTDIHLDRQMHGDITGFNQLFQQQKEAKGGERGGNHFSVLILHSHSADLCAQCLTAAFFYCFLGSFCLFKKQYIQYKLTHMHKIIHWLPMKKDRKSVV